MFTCKHLNSNPSHEVPRAVAVLRAAIEIGERMRILYR